MVIRRIDFHAALSAIVAFAALLACGVAAADPPARVARMATVGGAVTFSPAGEDEWVPATPNRPLITGDRVWADADARAELQIGSLAVRLGSQTSVTILNLDDRVAQFQLEQGALNVRVRRIDPGQTIEIDTPLLAFSLSRPGVYRIDVDGASAATTIAVRSGEGDVYGEGAAYTISDRQWYRFADTQLRDYQYDALPPADAFDAWTRDRDRREDSPVAARYVSPDVIGYSDLDEYGTWSTVEGYGNVWMPTRVASDWAPYQQGRWTWIEPWGWTWVDDAPWGFAPFHYGRWAYAGERWCWVPGPVQARAVYAPALVAFVGGNNFHVSVGTAGPVQGIAWFPLAPGEVYRPSYQVSRSYFTNVNISNTLVTNVTITNVYNRPDAPNTVYRNRGQRGGVTAMPAVAFAQSRPVAQSAVPVSRQLAGSGPVTPVAAVAPVRASVFGGAGTAAGSAPGAGARPVDRPPATTLQRPVVARVAPPAPRAPFNAREAALAKDPGRPADPAALVTSGSGAATPAPAAPVVKLVRPATPGAPPPAPTAPRPRTNAGPAAAGGSTAAVPSATPPAPPPKTGPATAIPQPPEAQSTLPAKPPARPDTGASAAKAEKATQTGENLQPPKGMEMRRAPAMPPQAAEPAPATTPPPTDRRREPSPSTMVNKPPEVQPPAAEMRRAPPPTPVPAPAVAKPSAAPASPPAEPPRHEPPIAKPPSAQSAPPAAQPARPPAPSIAPPPVVRPAEPKPEAKPKVEPKVEPAKGEARKEKAEEKRDDPK
jgi:hypothetical protein